ncbi:valine--tRNA ligase [Patescibacteria group bacterium]|nr:valine--tRNA ligase [Patescibacteria group bacterium]
MPKQKELPKSYDPKATEQKIYKLWEKSGFFNPDNCIKKGVTKKNADTFSIILPPPNVTGRLHMGHAAMLAVEDIMIRYNRMKGRRTLWLPGTDHAAIATQSKVENDIYKKERKTRHDLGRTKFLKMVEQFARDSHDIITHQLKKMGSSLDWSREAFTLDSKRNLAVRTAFKRMYDEGLIYRGVRIVNWDPKMQTTVSDDEIEWKEEKANFYYLKYGPFTIGTARPETKFGDKYVVMHPKDKRYRQYKPGQEIEVEWMNGKITATVIKDEAVDMEFGTGVMTITPWHDAADFEIAERHNLDKEQIVDERGKLLPIAKEFSGLHISKARPAIVEKLKEKGLLEKIDENYMHRIATNSRGGGLIEPQILLQWFIDVNKKIPGRNVSLKELMRNAVEKKDIKILPERFEKIYYHWIDNLRDWCISRQLWYGHQIPVWYRNKEVYCGITPPRTRGWKQDPDTLDTWFSSGLWTFSTLGWPKQTKDLKTYHPTSVLETGYDILFFWVARMILMTGYHLKDIPFHTVYLHGLVRDTQGKKMAKSLGNVIDPLEMIEKYGADATRLSLIIGAAAGNDIKLSEDKVRGYRNFINKLWNISRFIFLNTEDFNMKKKPNLTLRDKKILADFEKMTKKTTAYIETYRFSLAAESLYHYLWHTVGDKVLEQSKPVLQDQKKRAGRQYVLLQLLKGSLVLLHPFIPFATEEIYQKLPLKEKKQTLMIEHWPT